MATVPRLWFLVWLLPAIVFPGYGQVRSSPGATGSLQVGPPCLAAICVPELDSSVAWYQKYLGFKKLETITLPELRIAFLDLNGFRLEVVEDTRAFTREMLQKRIPELKKLDNPLAGIAKIAFNVTDFDTFAARLKSEGVSFQTKIMKAQGTWPRSFIVLDNNGNWIQFFEASRK